eukprot:COSAG06_NODE_405_length_16132_cov_9.166532_15_plen_132_part_00
MKPDRSQDLEAPPDREGGWEAKTEKVVFGFFSTITLYAPVSLIYSSAGFLLPSSPLLQVALAVGAWVVVGGSRLRREVGALRSVEAGRPDSCCWLGPRMAFARPRGAKPASVQSWPPDPNSHDREMHLLPK